MKRLFMPLMLACAVASASGVVNAATVHGMGKMHHASVMVRAMDGKKDRWDVEMNGRSYVMTSKVDYDHL